MTSSILEKLYKSDQRNISIWETQLTDSEFYKRSNDLILKLNLFLKSKPLLTPKDHFMCAMLFHHNFKLSSSKKALMHIKKAQGAGYLHQKWLYASIIDRSLQLKGKPQKYGTQITKLKNGKIRQFPLDGSISDKERIAIGLPPIKILKKDLEKS